MTGIELNALYYRTLGEGKPLLVIHGGPGLTHDYFLPEFSRLAEGHLLIFYDQRGCGRSAEPFEDQLINLDQYIDDIETIRKELEFEKISILGHSWGAFLALHYGLIHSERVEKLILSNAIPISSKDNQVYEEECAKRLAPFQKELDELESSFEFKRYFDRISYISCYNSEKAKDLDFHFSSNDFTHYQKVRILFNESLFSRPYTLDLSPLDAPTLIIHGDHDIIPPSIAESLHQKMPHSEYLLMKQCGHYPHIEDPENFFRTINAFINKRYRTQ